ncbi:MAG: hypothetical protein U0805_00670 [Pirellulales bacterium]
MTYQFPPDIEKRVRAQMGSSGAANEDDVLRAAMDALEQLDEIKLRRWQAGNDLALRQSAAGLSKPLNLGTLLERVEERAAGKRAGS